MKHKQMVFWLCAIALFLLFFYLLRGVLLPFVLGMLTAYFLDPAADKLEEKGWSRTMATVFITGCFFLVLAIFFLVVPPIIFDQFRGLLAALPRYIERFNEDYSGQISYWLNLFPGGDAESVRQAAGEATTQALTHAGEFFGSIFMSGLVIINVIGLVLITPVVTFYLLRDWDNIVARFDTLLPREHLHTIREQMHRIDRTLAGFVRGQLNVCLILGLFYAIGLSLAGLRFGFVIGLFSGLLIIIPYVGAIVSFVIGAGIAFFQFESFMEMLPTIVVYGAGQVLESYFLTPKLVGDKVGLHPVWVIFGMLAGGSLFGFVGVLVAVPATAVIGVLIRFGIDQYLHSPYYRGDSKRKRAGA